MKKGFTILELIVSVTILAIGILSLAQIFPMAMRSSLNTRCNTQAMEYNQKKVEWLRNTLWEDTLSLKAGLHDTVDLPLASGMSSKIKFKQWYVVTDNWPTTDMKKIDVYTSYEQAVIGNTNHVTTMRTYISKN